MNTGDTAWVLISTGLVLFMTIGLALFYGGMVNRKHAMSTILQCISCIGIVTLVWTLIAFTLAFSQGNSVIGGFSLAALHGADKATLAGMTGEHALSVPNLAFFHYHLMFAIITPALAVGSLTGRLKFAGWALFVAIWAIIVYAPVARWLFSPAGWLSQLGAEDFAGGAVVHTTAGAAALALLIVIGRRHGWPGPKTALRPNSLPLVLLGTGILWFGWFGFNAGSALGANELAVHALVNTQIAGAAGLVFWLGTQRVIEGNISSLGGASGAIAGLACITPAAGYVGPIAAMIIGALAGIVCFAATRLKYIFRYDDALDVIGVHLIGGMLGMILLGFFARPELTGTGSKGLFFGGGLHLIGSQFLAVVVVFVYAFVLSLILGWIIHKIIGMRVSAEQEERGIDISELVESAYDSAAADSPVASPAPTSSHGQGPTTTSTKLA
ncbi:ammonium transporter [Devriesea agamarum]|uniref:ammonium transporter n=1 Tax=Devriesea agamarum TaxID=472569 RepID=UPI000A03E2EB|nr:ammonium transporter [Devriesea agamarum]